MENENKTLSQPPENTAAAENTETAATSASPGAEKVLPVNPNVFMNTMLGYAGPAFYNPGGSGVPAWCNGGPGGPGDLIPPKYPEGFEVPARTPVPADNSIPPEDRKFCTECGSPNRNANKYCTECGHAF